MASKHIAVSVALALAVGTLAVGTIATVAARAPSSTFKECTDVMESQVCTWVKMEGSAAVELGAAIPMAIVEGVSPDAEMAWPPERLATVALPAEARAALGMDHMGINWEPHGHPPSVFLTPHFDFHFYNIATEDVDAIDCSDASKPATLPARYVLPDLDIPGLGMLVGLCVPRMGMHAMNGDVIEGTELFDAALLVGYYGGVPIFFEPMLAQDRLRERTDFSIPLPPVAGLPDGVAYPSEFRAEYDASRDLYSLVFSGFDAR
jgi:hypothetical protein